MIADNNYIKYLLHGYENTQTLLNHHVLNVLLFVLTAIYCADKNTRILSPVTKYNISLVRGTSIPKVQHIFAAKDEIS